MNKDNAKDYFPLVQALADGKSLNAGGWVEIEIDEFAVLHPPERYRIKPDPPKEIDEFFVTEFMVPEENRWEVWSMYVRQAAAESSCGSLQKKGKVARWRRLLPSA